MCLTHSHKQETETMATTTESTLTVRLPLSLKKAVKAAAKAEDLSVSQYIRKHFAAKVKRKTKAA